ncbi:MAG: hypothetical protein WD604_04915 [Balneolaceae bacterium]
MIKITVYLSVLLLLLAVTACEDHVPTTAAEKNIIETPRTMHAENIAGRDDPGMIMRQRIRNMDENDFKNLVEKSNLTVMIGFKEELQD